MSAPPTMSNGEQSQEEELANSISHGAGLVAALVASPFLVTHAMHQGRPGYIVGTSIFVATMVLLYLTSTLYHALRPGRIKHVVRIIEHSAIFLLIAGTYTPFTLALRAEALGWTLVGTIWGLAGFGVVLKVINGAARPVVFTVLYLLMGWLIPVVGAPIYAQLPSSSLVWLIAGGVAYTSGVVFFTIDTRIRYSHFIWHLFVLVGSSCHYFAVFRVVM